MIVGGGDLGVGDEGGDSRVDCVLEVVGLERGYVGLVNERV